MASDEVDSPFEALDEWRRKAEAGEYSPRRATSQEGTLASAVPDVKPGSMRLTGNFQGVATTHTHQLDLVIGMDLEMSSRIAAEAMRQLASRGASPLPVVGPAERRGMFSSLAGFFRREAPLAAGPALAVENLRNLQIQVQDEDAEAARVAMSALEAHCEHLDQELARSREQVEDLEEHARAMAEENHSLAAASRSSRRELVASASHLEALRRQGDGALALSDELREQLAQKEREVQRLEAELGAVREDVEAGLRAVCEDLEAELRVAREELEASELRGAHAAAGAEAEVRAVRGEKKALEVEVAALRAESQAAAAREAEVAACAAALEQRSRELEGDAEALRQRLASAEARAEALEAQLGVAAAEAARLGEAQGRRLEAGACEIERLGREAAELREQLAAAEGELTARRLPPPGENAQEGDATEVMLQEVRARVDAEVRSLRQAADAEVERARREAAAAQAGQAAAQAGQAAAEAQASHARASADRAQARAEKLAGESAAAEAEVQALGRELQEAGGRQKLSAAQCERLRAELQALREQSEAAADAARDEAAELREAAGLREAAERRLQAEAAEEVRRVRLETAEEVRRAGLELDQARRELREVAQAQSGAAGLQEEVARLRRRCSGLEGARDALAQELTATRPAAPRLVPSGLARAASAASLGSSASWRPGARSPVVAAPAATSPLSLARSVAVYPALGATAASAASLPPGGARSPTAGYPGAATPAAMASSPSAPSLSRSTPSLSRSVAAAAAGARSPSSPSASALGRSITTHAAAPMEPVVARSGSYVAAPPGITFTPLAGPALVIARPVVGPAAQLQTPVQAGVTVKVLAARRIQR